VIGKNKFDIKIDFKKQKSQLKYCPFVFRGSQCGYLGSSTFCPKHFQACRELGNEARFGDFVPNPERIPKIPEVKRTFGLFPENAGKATVNDVVKGMKKEAIEERLRQVSMAMEERFLGGSAYSTLSDKSASEPTKKMEFKWAKEEQLECPSGFPEDEWNNTPVTIRKMILKRLGYNREKENDNKDTNRAIDL